MDAKERQARADYGQQLNALKSATKPEINFLTMLAQDYVPYAPAVRDVLVDRIKNRPGNNLHLLYLMDSICKIVQGPYPPLFAERIYDIVYNVAAQVQHEHEREHEYAERITLNPTPTSRISPHHCKAMQPKLLLALQSHVQTHAVAYDLPEKDLPSPPSPHLSPTVFAHKTIRITPSTARMGP